MRHKCFSYVTFWCVMRFTCRASLIEFRVATSGTPGPQCPILFHPYTPLDEPYSSWDRKRVLDAFPLSLSFSLVSLSLSLFLSYFEMHIHSIGWISFFLSLMVCNNSRSPHHWTHFACVGVGVWFSSNARAEFRDWFKARAQILCVCITSEAVVVLWALGVVRTRVERF